MKKLHLLNNSELPVLNASFVGRVEAQLHAWHQRSKIRKRPCVLLTDTAAVDDGGGGVILQRGAPFPLKIRPGHVKSENEQFQQLRCCQVSPVSLKESANSSTIEAGV